MNVFIAGAAGYAGRAIAIALRRAGHSVTALLRNPDSERAHLLRGIGIQVIAGDLRRPATYRHELVACDVCISTVMDVQDPAATDRLLLETLRGLPITVGGAKRLLVYTSCWSVYGKVLQRLLDETTPGNPAHPLHFRLELEAEAFSLDNIRTVVVRPGFLYGQDGHSCFTNTWFEQGKTDQVVYNGDPGRGWSWVHVTDLADAYCRVAERSDLDKELFCIADQEQPRCADVAWAAANAAGFAGKLTLGPAIMEDWSALFDQDAFINSTNARRMLGWVPKQPGILAGINRYYQDWKASQVTEPTER